MKEGTHRFLQALGCLWTLSPFPCGHSLSSLLSPLSPSPQRRRALQSFLLWSSSLPLVPSLPRGSSLPG